MNPDHLLLIGIMLGLVALAAISYTAGRRSR